MALIKCHECGAQVSSEAKTCPKCGATPKSKTNAIKALIGIGVAAYIIWFFYGGGWEAETQKNLDQVNKSVAADAVQQYQIAKNNGNPVDICVAAGLVAATFLNAKDESNYSIWKSIESTDCKAAGVPN